MPLKSLAAANDSAQLVVAAAVAGHKHVVERVCICVDAASGGGGGKFQSNSTDLHEQPLAGTSGTMLVLEGTSKEPLQIETAAGEALNFQMTFFSTACKIHVWYDTVPA